MIDEQELIYQASPTPKIKKTCFIKPHLEPKWTRFGLPSLLQRINEEELLYQVSSKSRMKKNCSTKPGGILLDQKWRRIVVLSSCKNEEILVYQASSGPRMKNKLVHHGSINGKLRKIALPGLAQGLMNKNYSTMPPLDQDWRRIVIPGLLHSKIDEELVYQASPRGLKKNWFIRPPLHQEWRRIGLPGLL